MENGEKSAALSRNNKAKLQLSRASLMGLVGVAVKCILGKHFFERRGG